MLSDDPSINITIGHRVINAQYWSRQTRTSSQPEPVRERKQAVYFHRSRTRTLLTFCPPGPEDLVYRNSSLSKGICMGPRYALSLSPRGCEPVNTRAMWLIEAEDEAPKRLRCNIKAQPGSSLINSSTSHGLDLTMPYITTQYEDKQADH